MDDALFDTFNAEYKKVFIKIRELFTSDENFLDLWQVINRTVARCIKSAINDDPFLDDSYSPDSVFADAKFRADTRGEFEGYLFAAVFSFRWGRYLHKNHTDQEAVRFLARGLLNAGMWIGVMQRQEHQQLKVLEHQKRAEDSKKGGVVVAENYSVVKKELIRLLKCKDGGWESKKAAIDCVVNELWVFIQQKNNEINIKNKKLKSHEQKKTICLLNLGFPKGYRSG
uniref:hypothetical protein n=1 Tax=Photorhabdus sp. RM322S TaxID=3342825 RepID=UPI0036DA3297